MPSTVVGAVDFRNEALKDPVRTVVGPGAARLHKLASRNHRGMANEGDEIALTAGFDP